MKLLSQKCRNMYVKTQKKMPSPRTFSISKLACLEVGLPQQIAIYTQLHQTELKFSIKLLMHINHKHTWHRDIDEIVNTTTKTKFMWCIW